MSAARWILNFWPGLPQVWWRGTWQSLSVAVAFTVLLNCALVTSLLEGISWSPWVVVGLWVAVCMFSVGTCLTRIFDQSEVISRELARQRQALFREAQSEYLKGHWFEAEKLARQLLAAESSDAEARLLLVTILRRGSRYDEALGQLNRLSKCTTSGDWYLEIEQESEMINEEIRKQSAARASESLSARQVEPSPATLAISRKVA